MPNNTTIQKTVGVPLQKSAMSRTKSGTLTVKGLFTSDNKDMHGDIITRSATEKAIERYRQWGNIRRMHEPNPVGKVLGIGEADGLAWNEVQIEVINKDAADEVESGLLQALSIGALINFEDITWLDDGGMLISDYLLGEISLVDHPGNYDAVLSSDKAANTDVHLLVKRYGLDTLSKEMLSILEENKSMSEQTDLEKEALETETEDIATEEISVEDDDVEATKEIETEDETATEVVEETEEAIEETEETSEEVVDLSVDDEEDVPVETEEEETDRLENIEAQLTVLTDLVKSLVGKEAEVATETVEEDQDTGEVDSGSEDAEVPTDAHKAVVPETDAVEPTDKSVEENDDNSTRLYKALSAKFNQR